MKIVGYSCPHCGNAVLDCLDHCYHCKQPYTDTLAAIAKAHHEAKMRMVMVNGATDRVVTENEILTNTSALASVSEGLAATQKAGIEPPLDLITDAFALMAKG